jgi:translation initiation factor IF-3
LLTNLVAEVAEHGEAEGSPRMEGRSMHVIIGPKKK